MSFDFSSVDFEAGDVSSDINVDSDSLDYGSETLTESTDQVGNFAGNSEFVTATDPSSITNAPTSVPGSDFVGPPAPSAFDNAVSGLKDSAAGLADKAKDAASGAFDKIKAEAGSLVTKIEDQFSAKNIEAFATKTAKNLVASAENLVVNTAKNYANQALSTVVGPAAAATLTNGVTRSLTGPATTGAKTVSSSVDPNSPNFVGPPAPSNTSPTPTNAGPSFQQFDDGSSRQTFEDGSTLTIDADGKPTSTPAPADDPNAATKSTTTTGPTDKSASNVGYVTGQDPENGTYYVKNEKTGAIVSSGLTEQQATLKAQDQTFVDAGDVPPGANPGSNAVNYTAPGAATDTNLGALATQAADSLVKASTPGTVNDANLALPPISTQAALAAAAALIPGGTAVTTAIADTAARAQGLLRQAQNQQTARVQANNNAATGDWRVRLQLADSSDYLYNAPDCGPLLWPLRDTNGVIFPYTPTIDTSYKANYSTYDLTQSNYRGYFYQNSYIDGINIKATFTAQDSAEANYLLAVIHFFRSVTKMFYGQDAQRGTPPPMVFLSGLGDFQFNKHPCLVQQFNYNLPADVNYIRAQSTLSNGGNQLAARTRQTTLGNPIASTIQRLSSLGQKIFPGAVTAPFAPQGSLAAGNPTYVPTKMEISLVLLPVQTRSQVSQQFSVRGFANGNLLKGGFW